MTGQRNASTVRVTSSQINSLAPCGERERTHRCPPSAGAWSFRRASRTLHHSRQIRGCPHWI